MESAVAGARELSKKWENLYDSAANRAREAEQTVKELSAGESDPIPHGLGRRRLPTCSGEVQNIF